MLKKECVLFNIKKFYVNHRCKRAGGAGGRGAGGQGAGGGCKGGEHRNPQRQILVNKNAIKPKMVLIT
jgi:hypothetical protein